MYFIAIGNNLLGRHPDDKVLSKDCRGLMDSTNRLPLVYAIEARGDALSYVEVRQNTKKYQRDATARRCHAWQQVIMGLVDGPRLTVE